MILELRDNNGSLFEWGKEFVWFLWEGVVWRFFCCLEVGLFGFVSLVVFCASFLFFLVYLFLKRFIHTSYPALQHNEQASTDNLCVLYHKTVGKQYCFVSL